MRQEGSFKGIDRDLSRTAQKSRRLSPTSFHAQTARTGQTTENATKEKPVSWTGLSAVYRGDLNGFLTSECQP